MKRIPLALLSLLEKKPPGEEALLPVKFLISNELPETIQNVILSYTIFDITDYNQEKLAHNNMQMEKN